MRRSSLVLAAVTAGTLLAAGCGGASSSHSPRPLSAACKHDIAVQDAFVHRQIAAGYPNVPAEQGILTVDFDRGVLKGLRKVCPGTVKIDTLPSG